MFRKPIVDACMAWAACPPMFIILITRVFPLENLVNEFSPSFEYWPFADTLNNIFFCSGSGVKMTYLAVSDYCVLLKSIQATSLYIHSHKYFFP